MYANLSTRSTERCRVPTTGMKPSRTRTINLDILPQGQICVSDTRKMATIHEYTITNTYMDDVFGASKTDEEIERKKDEIGKEWEIKDVGESEYFLGMRVQQDLTSGTIRLTQRRYWEHVLNRFSLTVHNSPYEISCFW